MYTYKVIEKRKKQFLQGALTVQQLEKLLNTHANEGWILDRIVAGETARFMGLSDKDVFIIIFKKEIVA